MNSSLLEIEPVTNHRLNEQDTEPSSGRQRCHEILLKRPRRTSASEMFVAAGVNTFNEVLRNVMHKCICRVDESENEIIIYLSNVKYSTTRYQSQLWNHWYRCLFIKHV